MADIKDARRRKRRRVGISPLAAPILASRRAIAARGSSSRASRLAVMLFYPGLCVLVSYLLASLSLERELRGVINSTSPRLTL